MDINYLKMGLLDKAKKLGTKAFDSATAASNSVMEKTGVSQKLHSVQINSLAFSTDEQLRHDYLVGNDVGKEMVKKVVSLIVVADAIKAKFKMSILPRRYRLS